MALVSELRAGLAKNLQTIPGLRTSQTIPDQANPPIAIITPTSIEYHKSFANGIHTYNFTVTVIVGRVSERSAQNNLDAYCSTTSDVSILKAIESDKTLSGKAFTLVVSDMRNYGSVVLNENTYMAAEFDCAVQAN